MKLRIVTPMKVVLDADNVKLVRAEDETGAFGIQPHHTSFLTVLGVSIISWRDNDDKEHYAAVRGAVFQIANRNVVEVAARDAVISDSLQTLSDTVLKRFREQAGREAMSKTSSAKLSIALIRQLQKYLEAGRMPPGEQPYAADRTISPPDTTP